MRRGDYRAAAENRFVPQMNDVQSFIDASHRVETFEDLRRLMADITCEMGFDRFALVHHVDLRGWAKRQAVALSNYPAAWVDAYINQRQVARDPTLLAAQRAGVGFRWGDIPKLIPFTSAHATTLEQARASGLVDGFTIPANIPGEANGSCHFAVDAGHVLPEANLAMAQLVGQFAFEAARALVIRQSGSDGFRRPARLTKRQLECLLWVARGKTDWEIAQILGLAEDTVTEHVDEARRRYGVARRMELVMAAVFAGELPLNEVVLGA